MGMQTTFDLEKPCTVFSGRFLENVAPRKSGKNKGFEINGVVFA
jgi:hypothetical protein